MSRLKICQDGCDGVTIVPNRFIDEFMPQANDAQLKIYLYLLRTMNAGRPLDIPEIADAFNHTEKDVMRALKYWEKRGVLRLEYDTARTLTGIRPSARKGKQTRRLPCRPLPRRKERPPQQAAIPRSRTLPGLPIPWTS